VARRQQAVKKQCFPDTLCVSLYVQCVFGRKEHAGKHTHTFVCVCVRVLMFKCISVNIQCVFGRKEHAGKHTHTFVCLCVCVCVSLCVNVCPSTYSVYLAEKKVQVKPHILFVCVCVCVFMCKCLSVYIHCVFGRKGHAGKPTHTFVCDRSLLLMHIYIYIYIYIYYIHIYAQLTHIHTYMH
jgi:hypothetical protein